MTEEMIAKITAKLQDLSAQLTEMKEQNQELRQELRKINKEQKDPTQVAEKAAKRANMAYDYCNFYRDVLAFSCVHVVD